MRLCNNWGRTVNRITWKVPLHSSIARFTPHVNHDWKNSRTFRNEVSFSHGTAALTIVTSFSVS